MNLKIFIVPVAIVLMIWATIGFISPQYSETRLLRESLKKETDNLTGLDVLEKNKNKLIGDLEVNNKKKDILRKYIPTEANHEEIVDDLQYLSNRNSLLAYDISIEKEVVAAGVSLAEVEGDGSASEGAAGKNSSKVSGLKTIYVSFGVVGAYENIRMALENISKLPRFNQIVNLKIAKIKNNNTQEEGVDYPSSNNLRAMAIIAFNYAPVVSVSNNPDNAIFSSDTLNISVVDQIEKIYTTSISELKVDSFGRTNIFSFP